MRTIYKRKTVQDLKPQWYLQMSTKDKLKAQKDLVEEREIAWKNKPTELQSNMILAKTSTNSITEGNTYRVLGHFCTLVTTIYYSEWHEFVTFKNKYGHTVKMNLRKFDVVKEVLEPRKFEKVR